MVLPIHELFRIKVVPQIAGKLAKFQSVGAAIGLKTLALKMQ